MSDTQEIKFLRAQMMATLLSQSEPQSLNTKDLEASFFWSELILEKSLVREKAFHDLQDLGTQEEIAPEQAEVTMEDAVGIVGQLCIEGGVTSMVLSELVLGVVSRLKRPEDAPGCIRAIIQQLS